jgi:protein-tyrosine phosphatase
MRAGVGRESAVAVWVSLRALPTTGEHAGKIKIPTQAKSGLEWGTQHLLYSGPHKTLRGMGMDISWLTDKIAVGGGIWNADNMAKVAQEGITHIIDMQIEFDDTPLAVDHGIAVLWNPTDDDFAAKPQELFRRGVEFARTALDRPDGKLFIHCAAGVHRAPMMALAILGSMEWKLGEAMGLIQERRPVADFAEVYVRSVEEFLGKA